MRIRSLAFRRALASVALALGIVLQAGPAVAADAPSQQVLDRVYAYNASAVLNMHFGNLDRSDQHFTDQFVNASLIATCTLTSVDGLWCLDGGLLRKWSNPLDLTVTGAPESLITCDDPGLGIEASCTGMTVDKSGVIWLAGKKKGTTSKGKPPSDYIVVKVTENANCPAGKVVNDLGPVYCAEEAYSGKSPISQLSAVDGDAAKAFQAGVLAIEDLKNVVFIPANGTQPFLIPGSPQGNPKFGEVLDDVSFVVFNDQGYVIATTNSGHVLAKNVSTTGGSALKVFQIPSERQPGSKKCSNAKSQYAIRGAPTSSIVFVSDRQYCQVLALAPNANFTALENLPMPEGGGDFTLTTNDESLGTFPTFGLTVASGIAIDLGKCEGECSYINSVDGKPAASLEGLNLNVQPGINPAATAFQLNDMPDCRYSAKAGFPKRALCADLSLQGVVVNPDGTWPTIDPVDGHHTQGPPYFPPEAQMLNVRLLLSDDVISGFESKGITLPDELLLSHHFKADDENNHLFGAVVVVHDPGVRYQGVFYGVYDVPALQGGPSQEEGEVDPRCVVVPEDPTLNDLLNWTVTTALSETHIGVGGKYIDSLANYDCGSIRGSYGRLSILPFNLEKTFGTYGPTILWPFGPKYTENNDAVFGRLVGSLIDDLGYVFRELGCSAADNSPHVPLPPGVCAPFSSARINLALLKGQFDLCMIGAFRSQAFEDSLPWYLPRYRPFCASALGRLAAFESALPPSDDTSPDDIANRLGEVHSRIGILRHVYTTRFLPSIPDAGFCRELNTCSP